MAEDVQYREVKGKLGIFGWTWRLLLLGWQALMVAWFVQYVSIVAPAIEAGGAEGAGAAIGGTIGTGMIVHFWVGGTIVLGLFVILTRRTKAMVPVSSTQSGD